MIERILVFGTFSKGFKGTHRHAQHEASNNRNCQSIKRNIIPQIRLSSFRRISPHFASALHINNISCSFRLFLFISFSHNIAPFIVATFSTYRFRFLLNFPSIFSSSPLFFYNLSFTRLIPQNNSVPHILIHSILREISGSLSL